MFLASIDTDVNRHCVKFVNAKTIIGYVNKGSAIKSILNETIQYTSAHTPELDVPMIRDNLLSITHRKGEFELVN